MHAWCSCMDHWLSKVYQEVIHICYGISNEIFEEYWFGCVWVSYRFQNGSREWLIFMNIHDPRMAFNKACKLFVEKWGGDCFKGKSQENFSHRNAISRECFEILKKAFVRIRIRFFRCKRWSQKFQIWSFSSFKPLTHPISYLSHLRTNRKSNPKINKTSLIYNPIIKSYTICETIQQTIQLPREQ